MDREVDGYFSFTGNSNFGGCILTDILRTLLSVTLHRSCFVCSYGSSVKLLALLSQNASILFIVTSYRSETQKLKLSLQPVWLWCICHLPQILSTTARHLADQCCFHIVLCSPTCLYCFHNFCWGGTELSFYFASVQGLVAQRALSLTGALQGRFVCKYPKGGLDRFEAIPKLCRDKEDACQKLERGHSSLQHLAWSSLQILGRSCTLMCLPDLLEADVCLFPPCSKSAS